MEYFGTDGLDESALTVDERVSRCYELAAYALTIGSAPPNATLVHGTWHHVVYATRRISHAWLELPNGHIWEPIQGKIWDNVEWDLIMRPTEEARYTKEEARNAIMFHRHWGRWHESKYL